jgi:hypothetical protein
VQRQVPLGEVVLAVEGRRDTCDVCVGHCVASPPASGPPV